MANGSATSAPPRTVRLPTDTLFENQAMPSVFRIKNSYL